MKQDLLVSQMSFEVVSSNVGDIFIAASNSNGSVNFIKLEEFDRASGVEAYVVASNIVALLKAMVYAKELNEATYSSLMAGLRPLIRDHFVTIEAVKNKLFPSCEDWNSTAPRQIRGDNK